LLSGNIENAAEFIVANKSTVPDLNENGEIMYATCEFSEQFEQLSPLYIFGDTIRSTEFSNYVMDTLLATSKVFTTGIPISRRTVLGSSLTDVSYIFSNTPESSPLRRFVVDNHLALVDWSSIDKAGIDLPRVNEFFYDLTIQAMKAADTKKAVKAPYMCLPCNYHQHPDQPEGYSCNSKTRKLKT
jgi:hypothetical protein